MARGVIALLLLASCATAQPRAAKPVAKKPAARKVKPEPIVLAAPAPRIGSCGDAPRSEEKPSKSGWIWPVDGVVISKYGEGIEIAAPHGTPIWAARSGTVLVSSEREGYG